MTLPPARRYERLTRVPLAVLGLVFLFIYAWPILDTDVSARTRSACRAVGLVIWFIFIADFLIRLLLAEERRWFLRHNWLDLLLIALPMLRPLRALRGVVGLRVVGRGVQPFARRRVVLATVIVVVSAGGIAALAMLDAERSSPVANIHTYGDALWWAMSTITTVGYGDRFPTTSEGRIVAGGLMVAGVALLGVVTASLASWFVERVREVEDSEQETRAALEALTAELRALRENLRETPR